MVWGKRAEALGKFLTKGSRLFVEGGLRTSSYDDKEGNKGYRTEIVASNIILAGWRRGSRWRRRWRRSGVAAAVAVEYEWRRRRRLRWRRRRWWRRLAVAAAAAVVLVVAVAAYGDADDDGGGGDDDIPF